MRIKNKYKLGEEIFYPAADLRASRVFRGEITGIVVQEEEGEEIVAYQAGQAYAVRESDSFEKPEKAIERLVEILEEKKQEIIEDIDGAIVKIKEMEQDDIIFDLSAQYEEAQNAVEGTSDVPTEEPTTE
jgi:predicted hydrocarbon binding protein